MKYNRGDIVLIPFPFVTVEGMSQKKRPALVISDHSIDRRFDDLILVGITSKSVYDLKETEYSISEGTEACQLPRPEGRSLTVQIACSWLTSLST